MRLGVSKIQAPAVYSIVPQFERAVQRGNLDTEGGFLSGNPLQAAHEVESFSHQRLGLCSLSRHSLSHSISARLQRNQTKRTLHAQEVHLSPSSRGPTANTGFDITRLESFDGPVVFNLRKFPIPVR
jgi:hypothetical protein